MLATQESSRTPVPPRSQPNQPNGNRKRTRGIFDADFSVYITPFIVKLIYVLYIILFFIVCAFSILFEFFGGLFVGDWGAALFGIFIIQIVAFLALMLIRLALELTMVIFNIADNLKAVRKLLRGSGRPPGPSHLPSQ